MGRINPAMRPLFDPSPRVEEPERRKWIATHPCYVCGRLEGWFNGIHYVVEAAHTGPRRGLGVKADDDTCIPLCGLHHTLSASSHHSLGEAEFEQFHDVKLSEGREYYRKKYAEKA